MGYGACTSVFSLTLEKLYMQKSTKLVSNLGKSGVSMCIYTCARERERAEIQL